MNDGPYRAGGTPEVPVDPDAWRTRFVCVVCFGASSSRPGSCVEDGTPLSDLRQTEIEWEVRSFAQRRLQRMLAKQTRRRWMVQLGLPLVGIVAMRLSGCHVVPPALLFVGAWLFGLIVFGERPGNVPADLRPSSSPLVEVLGWLGL